VQRVDAEVWRYRLVGTEVDRRWGRPLTGVNCIEIAAPEAAACHCRSDSPQKRRLNIPQV
jgi:hypothetical protein